MSPPTSRQAPLDVAEFGRRIALFQSRPPAPKRLRTSLEAALVDLFKTVESRQHQVPFEPWEAELLEAAVQSWRRPPEQPRRGAFFQRVFDALPTPLAVFCEEGVVWNRSLAGCLASAEGETTPEAQRAYVERMAATLHGVADMRVPVLYYALGNRLYRIAVTEFSELHCSTAYLFPDGRTLPDIEPAAQQLIAYRLSGLSLKQIGPLLGLNYSRVEGLSKRNRRHLMRLRSESCPEAAG